MQVQLDRVNDDYLFKATGGSDVPVYIDNKVDGVSNGASPMELLLMGVAGCSAIDIIFILKKQRQKIDGYHIKVDGSRKELKDAKPFESMNVQIFLEGEIDNAKAIRAAQLSFEKYCSVSLTMGDCVRITYEINLNGSKIL